MGRTPYKSAKEGGGGSFKYVFLHVTTKECPCHVPATRGLQTQTAEPAAASKSTPDSTQHSEQKHITSEHGVYS